jgi:hypothetical protein
LSGGNPLVAFEAMLGDPVFKLLRQKDGRWARYDLKVRDGEKDASPKNLKITSNLKEQHSADDGTARELLTMQGSLF